MSDNNSGNAIDDPKANQGEGEGANGGFKPPASQDELDRIIAARLKRQEASFKTKYAEVFTKAEELDALKEKDKTELEKANERAEKAERELSEAKAQAERARWAQKASEETGVPVSMMHGESEEEVIANARAIKEFAGAQSKYPSTPNGGDPAGSHGKMTKESILAVKDRRERQKLMAENAELFVRNK